MPKVQIFTIKQRKFRLQETYRIIDYSHAKISSGSRLYQKQLVQFSISKTIMAVKYWHIYQDFFLWRHGHFGGFSYVKTGLVWEKEQARIMASGKNSADENDCFTVLLPWKVFKTNKINKLHWWGDKSDEIVSSNGKSSNIFTLSKALTNSNMLFEIP